MNNKNPLLQIAILVSIIVSIQSCIGNKEKENPQKVEAFVAFSDTIYRLEDSTSTYSYGISNKMTGPLVIYTKQEELKGIRSTNETFCFELETASKLIQYRDETGKNINRSYDFKPQSIPEIGNIQIPQSWVQESIDNEQVISLFNDTSKYFSDYTLRVTLVKEKFDFNQSLAILLETIGKTITKVYKCQNLISTSDVPGQKYIAKGIQYENFDNVSDSEGVFYLFRHNQSIYSLTFLAKDLKHKQEFYSMIEFVVTQLNNS